MSNNTIRQKVNSSFVIVNLMAREGGATISDMTTATGLDRWAVRKLITNLEALNEQAKEPVLTVEVCNEDKRKTIFKIDSKKLWPAKISSIDFSPDEIVMLSLLFCVISKNEKAQPMAESIMAKLSSI